MIKKNKLILLVSFSVAYIATFLLATFYDYQISEAISRLTPGKYLSENAFGRFFETFGESPMYIIGGFASSIFIRGCLKIKTNVKKAILTSLSAFLCVIAYFLLFQRTTKYICEHFDVIETYKKYKLLVVIASTLLAVGSMALTVSITFKIPEEHLKGLIAFSLCVLFSVVLAQGIVHGIKGIIGRQRYRTIKVLEYYGLNNFIDYTRWYVINGKRVVGEELLALGVAKDGYKSFPSGHTCAAAVTFVLATIPDFLNLDDKKRIRVKGILLVVALTYTSLVALSRVVIGAHFLTDVLFAGAWTYFSTVISAKISKLITKRMKL